MLRRAFGGMTASQTSLPQPCKQKMRQASTGERIAQSPSADIRACCVFFSDASFGVAASPSNRLGTGLGVGYDASFRRRNNAATCHRGVRVSRLPSDVHCTFTAFGASMQS